MSNADRSQHDKRNGESEQLPSFLAWMKRSSSYVGEHGPEFVKQTRLRSLLAYRQGSRALATNALTASGVDLRSAAISMAVTVVFYFVLNVALVYWASATYDSHKPVFLADVSDISGAVTSLKEAGWIAPDTDAKKSTDILQGIKDEELRQPLYRWIEAAFLNPGMDNAENKLAAEMKRLATGSPRGWIYLQSKITTGSEVYKQLLNANRGTMSLVEGNAARKSACVAMLDELVGAVQGPIRWQLRMNGVIQMATVFVGLFVLAAVIRRYLFIARLASNWLGANLEATLKSPDSDNSDRELRAVVDRLRSSDDVDADALIRSEIDRLSRDTTAEIYDVYWFLAGIMPSLGFIGTVVGMSASLMMADRLFAASDRQLAIGRMTIELGLAFDTTLVALVFGLLAGIPIAAVHARERTFFREFATCIMKLRKKESRKETQLVSLP